MQIHKASCSTEAVVQWLCLKLLQQYTDTDTVTVEVASLVAQLSAS